MSPQRSHLALWKSAPLPPHPHHPGRRSDGAWKAAEDGTLPHPLENRSAVSHSPPATAAAGIDTESEIKMQSQNPTEHVPGRGNINRGVVP